MSTKSLLLSAQFAADSITLDAVDHVLWDRATFDSCNPHYPHCFIVDCQNVILAITTIESPSMMSSCITWMMNLLTAADGGCHAATTATGAEDTA